MTESRVLYQVLCVREFDASNALIGDRVRQLARTAYNGESQFDVDLV